MAYQVKDIEGAKKHSAELGKAVEELAVVSAQISGAINSLEGSHTAGLAEQVIPIFASLKDTFAGMSQQYSQGDVVLQKFLMANDEVANLDIGNIVATQLD